MKLIFSKGIEIRQKYDGKKCQGLRIMDQEQFGLKKRDNWYGGNLKKTALVADGPLVLLMDDKNNTIAVACVCGREDELSLEDAKAFGISFVGEDLDDTEDDVSCEDSEPSKEEPKKPAERQTNKTKTRRR